MLHDLTGEDSHFQALSVPIRAYSINPANTKQLAVLLENNKLFFMTHDKYNQKEKSRNLPMSGINQKGFKSRRCKY